MLKFFVKRPITTIMFVLFWVVLGLYSFSGMNIENTPSLDFPYVTARFIYPGAAPQEIESQILKKAEDAMSEVAGLKKITSTAYENGGYVMAEFNLGVNVNDKASEVKAKLDALSSQFPDDMKQPIVEKLNPLQQSVIDIAIYGADTRDLYEYTTDTLSNKITGIKGVANVNVFGGLKRAIRIEMSPDEMAARGVTIVDIVSALGNKNLNVPGGKIETGTGSSNVRFVGEFASVSEIENLQIVTSEGQHFKLTSYPKLHLCMILRVILTKVQNITAKMLLLRLLLNRRTVMQLKFQMHYVKPYQNYKPKCKINLPAPKWKLWQIHH